MDIKINSVAVNEVLGIQEYISYIIIAQYYVTQFTYCFYKNIFALHLASRGLSPGIPQFLFFYLGVFLPRMRGYPNPQDDSQKSWYI